jgi:ubiquinone/menaquinone biosynthesis C-methylase UbiE
MATTKSMILDARIGKSDIPKVYQKIAPKYDIWGKLAESKARNHCLELAEILDGESILEVAVGTGLAFVDILQSNFHGWNEGIDITKEMLTRAKEKVRRTGLQNYRLRMGDAYNLDYSDESFDLLVNNYMFDLLPEEDFERVLKEFKRVLRPGGRLVMVNMTRCERWYNAMWESLYLINPAWMGGCRGVYLLPYLQSLGFTSLKREFISQMTFPSEVVYGEKPSRWSSA